jgi:hypothetical protein
VNGSVTEVSESVAKARGLTCYSSQREAGANCGQKPNPTPTRPPIERPTPTQPPKERPTPTRPPITRATPTIAPKPKPSPTRPSLKRPSPKPTPTATVSGKP